MLGQRRRRLANVKPTLVYCIVFFWEKYVINHSTPGRDYIRFFVFMSKLKG